MVQFTLATPLGIPVRRSDFEQAHRDLERAGRLQEVDRTAAEQVMDATFRDGTLQHASGRWSPGRPDPDSFVPGDIPAVRTIAADAILRGLGAVSLKRATELHLQSTRGGRLDVLGDREALLLRLDPDRLLDFPIVSLLLVDLYRAVPYFIPTTAAVAVLASKPPQPSLQRELRLPFERTLVLFGADLELDPASYPWPRQFPTEQLDRFGVVGDLVRRGGHLSGVVLLADDHGHLRDDVVWIVAANPNPDTPGPASLDRIRGLVRGYRHAATLGPLVTNVAAAVTWAIWRDPPPTPDLPANPTERQLRKALKRNSVRARERQGALIGVRVLDLARNAAHARAAPADPKGARSGRASPVPHLRSGHFRNVRVGPRDAFHHEPRWIPPTWVRGNLDSTDQRLVVRRIPSPAVWAPREVDIEHQPARRDRWEHDNPAPSRSVDLKATRRRDPGVPPLVREDPFEPGLG